MLRIIVQLSLVLAACSGDRVADPLSRSAEEHAIQDRITDTAFVPDDGFPVSWQFAGSAYRFEQLSDRGDTLGWEAGQWWIGRDIRERLSIVASRHEGRWRQRDGEMEDYPPYTRPFPIVILGRSLSDPDLWIRMGAGEREVTFRVIPLGEFRSTP